MDTKAITHILMNHYIYQKPEIARFNLSQLLGEGVLVTEEDKHKAQRKVMVSIGTSSSTIPFIDCSAYLLWETLH